MSENPKRHVVLTNRGLQSLTQYPLNKVDGIVLWHFVSNLPPVGEIVSQRGLEDKLAMRGTHINRAIKHLCEIGFLMRGPKVGLSYHYKLNPALFRIIS